MALARVLIHGGTKEQRVREAMRAAVESLIEEQYEILKGFYKLRENNRVVFVTQRSKEECNTLLTDVLIELKEEYSTSPHKRKFFTPYHFFLEQERSNSLIKFITPVELFNNLLEYTDHTKVISRSVIAEFNIYQLLKNSEVIYRLFTGGHGLTHFITVASEENLRDMEDSFFDEFKTTITLQDEINEDMRVSSADKSKLCMFALIEECRQLAEKTYKPDANYILGYMSALHDLEQKFKDSK